MLNQGQTPDDVSGIQPAAPDMARQLPQSERPELWHLNAEEWWHGADATDARYRAFVLVAGFCGLRLGEMLGCVGAASTWSGDGYR